MASDTPVRLFLVDDDPSILDVLARFFKLDERVEDVVTAGDGESALAKFDDEGPFDAVVCDERMPGMAGSEVLAEIRKRQPTAIRILMTGYQDQGAAINAINQAKIHRYVSKPVELSTLSNVLFGLVEERYMERVGEVDVQSARAMAKAIKDHRKRNIADEPGDR